MSASMEQIRGQTMEQITQFKTYIGRIAASTVNGVIENGAVSGHNETMQILSSDKSVNRNFNEVVSYIINNEIIRKTIALGVTLAGSYYIVKCLANVLDPTRQEKMEAQKRAERLMKQIGVTGVKLTEYELCIASNLVDPLSMTTSWQDIGGLDDVLDDIQESIILPFSRRDLYANTQLLSPPKGVLLFGPPGCGKTMIAKAMAKAAGARFINLQVSSLVDKWYGESQKRAEAVFSLAMKLQPTIIFIDEIDSFLRARASSDHEATAMIKTQFMSFWDGLLTDKDCQILIIGATNRPHDVDAAILRRMPCMFRIDLPKLVSRLNILQLLLEHEQVSSDLDLGEIAGMTEGFSGSDLRELCRNAATYRIRDYIRQEAAEAQNTDTEERDDDYVPAIRPLNRDDVMTSLKKIRQSNLIHLVAEQQISLD